MGDFKWRHFRGEIILWAVRWYCKYGISYRELEEMMTKRGNAVDHSTIFRWVQRYAPEMEKRLKWYLRSSLAACHGSAKHEARSRRKAWARACWPMRLNGVSVLA